MVNVCFGIFEKQFSSSFKFKNTKWKHIVGGEEVNAEINFLTNKKIGQISVRYGMVTDYKKGMLEDLIIGKNDIPYIYRKPIIQPIQIEFQILNNRYIKINKGSDLNMVLQNLNIVCGLQNIARHLNFDIHQLNIDFPVQWLGDIQKGGNWTSGKLKGHDIANDELLKDVYSDFTKKEIGITLQKPQKFDIKINQNGLIQIPKNDGFNFIPTGEEIIKIFVEQLVSYTGIGMLSKKVKNV